MKMWKWEVARLNVNNLGSLEKLQVDGIWCLSNAFSTGQYLRDSCGFCLGLLNYFVLQVSLYS